MVMESNMVLDYIWDSSTRWYIFFYLGLESISIY